MLRLPSLRRTPRCSLNSSVQLCPLSQFKNSYLKWFCLFFLVICPNPCNGGEQWKVVMSHTDAVETHDNPHDRNTWLVIITLVFRVFWRASNHTRSISEPEHLSFILKSWPNDMWHSCVSLPALLICCIRAGKQSSRARSVCGVTNALSPQPD